MSWICTLVVERMSSEAKAEFEEFDRYEWEGLKEVVVDRKGQMSLDFAGHASRDLGLEGGADPQDELRSFMQGLKDEIAALNDLCDAERAARAERLLKLTQLRKEKGLNTKKRKELTQLLAVALLEKEKSVAEQRLKKDTVAKKMGSEAELKWLTDFIAELEG